MTRQSTYEHFKYLGHLFRRVELEGTQEHQWQTKVYQSPTEEEWIIVDESDGADDLENRYWAQTREQG